MVIKTEMDVFDLLDSRVEAMEDLNCEELRDCVKAFLGLILSVTQMRTVRTLVNAKPDDAEYVNSAKVVFESARKTAIEGAGIIDELTLKSEDVE